jgi:hypothetical protein
MGVLLIVPASESHWAVVSKQASMAVRKSGKKRYIIEFIGDILVTSALAGGVHPAHLRRLKPTLLYKHPANVRAWQEHFFGIVEMDF